MSDPFEDRLRAALEASGGDPDAGGLAGAARSRARRRSARRTTGAVAAVLLAVVAVPVGIGLAGRGGTSGPPLLPDPGPASGSVTPAPEGLRVESWRDATVLVPEEWRYGGQSDWCANDGRLAPRVSRPGGAVLDIACTPRQGYGVAFGDAASADLVPGKDGTVWRYRWESPDQERMWPRNAWLGVRVVGAAVVWIATDDRATTQAVLDSVRRIGDRDPHGCTPRDGADAAGGDGDRLSVCRYGADGWLEQSELLTAHQSERFLAAVSAAPLVEGSDCAGGEEPGRVAVGAGADLGTVSVVFGSPCAGANGVTLSGTRRALTSDILYWALSPGWSGGVDGSVPMPDPLRR